jgi:hypothetical protein
MMAKLEQEAWESWDAKLVISHFGEHTIIALAPFAHEKGLHYCCASHQANLLLQFRSTMRASYLLLLACYQPHSNVITYHRLYADWRSDERELR